MAHSTRPLYLMRSATLLVREGQFVELAQKVLHRIVDETHLVGLRLDLERQQIPSGRQSVYVRPAVRSDVSRMLRVRGEAIDRKERHERMQRLRMMEAGVETCYVGGDGEGLPCFIQWLIPESQSEKLQEVYGGWYPPLREGEALLEFAYTAPDHRGKGVMFSATSQILKRGRDAGVRTVVTFIPATNTRSLAIHLRMGFVPYCLHRERRRLWSMRREFLPIGSLREVSGMVPEFDAGQFERLGPM